MKTTDKHNERIANMTFASVYPHYLSKVEKKGRTTEELHKVIEWLTGFDEDKLQQLIDQKATFETFFAEADLNPNAPLIKGAIRIDIRHYHAGGPGLAPQDPCLLRDILESEVPFVQVKPVRDHIPRQEDIHQAIVVDVPQGDSPAIIEVPVFEDVEILLVLHIVDKINPGAVRGEKGKERFPFGFRHQCVFLGCFTGPGQQ